MEKNYLNSHLILFDFLKSLKTDDYFEYNFSILLLLSNFLCWATIPDVVEGTGIRIKL